MEHRNAASPITPPMFRVPSSHSGSDFESGALHRAATHTDSSARTPGSDVEDTRETASLGGWEGGHPNFVEVNGRRKKLRVTLPSKDVMIMGIGRREVFKGSSAVEDERWVYILEVKDNGTKAHTPCLPSPASPHRPSQQNDAGG